MTANRSARFQLDVRPQGKASIRTGKGQRYTADKTEDAMREIALQSGRLHTGAPFDGPLRLELLLSLPRPKRLMRKKDPCWRVLAPIAPDASNCLKLVEDALQRCGNCGGTSPRKAGDKKKKCNCMSFRPIIVDDRLICDLVVSKRYGSFRRDNKEGEPPHINVFIEEMSE